MFGGSLGAISSKATWSDGFQIIDEETGEAIRLDDCEITLTVERDGDWGTILAGSTTSGEITFPQPDTAWWLFPVGRLGRLDTGPHRAGVLVTRAGETMQLFLGTVAVECGI